MLAQNWPNPFHPFTTIAYSVPVRMHVRISVTNALGREVSLPVDAVMDAGAHNVVFDCTNLPCGMYICRMNAGGGTYAIRMIVAK